MLKKGSKLNSILRFKCPQCQGDKLFDYKIYNLKKIGSMKSSCSNCGLVYAKEPGFFFGAAYVSYAVTVAFAVAIYVLCALFIPEMGWKVHLGLVIGGLVGLFPVAFALSRSIWLNIFFNYREA